jgi:uncharacterized membrane protein YphA (DoxX/SURF4 family)
MKAIRLITHRYLALGFRLYLAGLFIYASMYKINYTAEFAETIATYQMVPYWLVNAMAVGLPWAELICSILLFVGIRVRSCAVLFCGLLLIFTLAILVSLVREAPISCGCFHTLGDTISWWTLLRDLIWLSMTIHVILFDRSLHLDRKFTLIAKEI